MFKAIYPGSFDPATFGHIDIIERMHPFFSELTVVVANSESKNYLFTLDQRVELLHENLKQFKNVKIDTSDGLTVDYATRIGARVIIRGIRAVSDFEYEYAMANINRTLDQKIETMIVFTKPEYGFIASRMVKEVAKHGGDLSQLVPANVAQALKRSFQNVVT